MKVEAEVIEVVWYTCEECDCEGVYPVYTKVECPDCDGVMLSAHPEKGN